MNIISWNVNGIRAALRKGFLAWMEEYSPDVICVQETKLQHEQIPDELLQPFEYRSYWAHAEKKGYSGVATFVKGDQPKVKIGLGIDDFDSEGRSLVHDFGDFVLINGYFPNGGRGPERVKFKLEYYDKLLKFVRNILDEGKHIIITGDFNTAHNEIDLANPESNRKKSGFMDIEREWIEKYLDFGLVDTFREIHPGEVKYSWWDYRTRARERDAGWRIDYFMVDKPFFSRVKKSYMLSDIYGSDHCPIVLEFD